MTYDTKNNTSLTGLAIWIQCTWCRTFTEPVKDKGLCIRSYDRKITKVCPAGAKQNQIGTLTGNYFTDASGVIWLEATLLFCNRRPSGWFREADIWHSLKGTAVNPIDAPYINSSTAKSVLFALLTGGATLLSFFH